MKEKLQTKIQYCLEEDWIPNNPIRIEILEQSQKLGLSISVWTKSENWKQIHTELPTSIHSVDDLNDLLGRALSQALMHHPSWWK